LVFIRNGRIGIETARKSEQRRLFEPKNEAAVGDRGKFHERSFINLLITYCCDTENKIGKTRSSIGVLTEMEILREDWTILRELLWALKD
jgi:hypothetical protein